MEVQCVPIQFAFICAICLWLMYPHQYAFCRRCYKCHQTFICILITCIRHWDFIRYQTDFERTAVFIFKTTKKNLKKIKNPVYMQDFSEKSIWKSNRNSWQSLLLLNPSHCFSVVILLKYHLSFPSGLALKNNRWQPQDCSTL